MGRKNNAARQRNAKGRLNRREKGASRRAAGVKTIPRTEVEDLIIPDGQCLRNPRKPKAKFNTPEAAQKALEQAQRQRVRNGSAHMEKRWYVCPSLEGGCGGYHLTSRESYDPAWKRATA